MNWTVKFLLFLWAFCFSVSGISAQDRHQQEIDSLRVLVKSSEGVKRGAALLSLGKEYMIRSNYLVADSCYTAGLAIAEKENNDALAAQAYASKSIIFFYQHSYRQSLEADNRALHLFEKLRDTGMMAFQLKSIADSYLQMGDSGRASTWFGRALPIFIALHDYKGQAAVYANQSILTLGDMRKSIALRLKAKDLWDRYPVDNILPTINLGNLGEGYLDVVRNRLSDRIPPSDTFPRDRVKLLALGEGYLRSAIRMAHANGDVEDSSYFTGVLAELEEQKGDFRHAYYDFRAYQNIMDSIYSQENKNKLAEIENARAIDRKNQEIATKELQIGEQHKKLWLLASCIALLAVTGGLLYRQSLVRQRNNAQLQRLNAELDEANKVKAKFFGILSHDLRSPVSRLVHFLQLQEMEPDMLSPADVEQQAIRIRQSAQTLLETMESVLLWSKGQMERFQPEFSLVKIGELFNEVARLYPAHEGVTYSFYDDEGTTVRIDRHYLRSILYNLTANATRAVAGVADAAVIWRAWTEGENVKLSITDNGPGVRDPKQLAALFDETAVSGSGHGLGLHIIRDLGRAIGAQMEVQPLPEGGMRFVITISALPPSGQ